MQPIRFLYTTVMVLLISTLLQSFYTSHDPAESLRFPYKHAGLTEREAAAHLLDRFTYGATPGQVDSVVKMGLENWFLQQLKANLPDDSLNKRLSSYDAIYLSNAEVCSQYPKRSFVVAMAVQDSSICKDSVDKAANKKAYNGQIKAYMQKKGYKSDQELYKQFISQKILRAIYTNNQMQEVLTDFWFNHFNVSFTKNDCAHFIPAYERDVIRPNVFGKFDKLLLATAKSPAMLYFLDNFISVGPPALAKNKAKPVQITGEMPVAADTSGTAMPAVKKAKLKKNAAGLNENYAREVMELHTMGVDGGYTQKDVTEAARILTGWTVYPLSTAGPGSAMRKLVDRIGEENLAQKGFVHEGDFLFTPNRHDPSEKTVLGHYFPANGGYQEGVDLLEMLAHHASTAKFISRKLAVRFVNDNPSQDLINKMAKAFTEHDGDISQVLIAMVSSRDFWNKKAVREKIRSPFELAISSARSLHADVLEPYPLFNWISRMGQKIYYYQAPTGFPDKAQYWINTGALLNRMNFSLSLASQQIAGVKVNLAALNDDHEPGSAAEALVTYCKLLMPERDLDNTIRRLMPLLNDPNLAVKVNNAAAKVPEQVSEKPSANSSDDLMNTGPETTESKPRATVKSNAATQHAASSTMLAQVVGIIIGSPEFQRR